jgi:ATP-binding cassette subfamily B protein
MLTGASEMKLNNFDVYKRIEWEKIQEKLLLLKLKSLKIDQFQLAGFEFLNQLKNILVTFFAASLVTKDMMSLGALLSVSYIIGQMNSPVSQLVNFFRSLQEAKLSLQRLNEVQTQEPEEKVNQILMEQKSIHGTFSGIKISNLKFQYEGPLSPFVLNNINIEIPEGKITAIVGASGSGKSTLLKLLLRFYDPTEGNIFYDGNSILSISPKNLRYNCGVVMQEGYIFADTIYRNIVMSDESNDMKRFNHAVHTANINQFIESLPLGENTKIGSAGSGISGGQKQRLLIARAVYKNPNYLLFDEATSSLDAENESVIHNNLQDFFKGKTVIIVAHRLSTVKNADQIIVLNNGNVSEIGNHKSLVAKKGEYYNLVKNQLELGN